jgi:5-methylcytosine-specific restriction endonuclease McrA
MAEILNHVLDVFIARAERRKFATTSRPQPRKTAATSPDTRYIPAAVRRAVAERDGHRCTFVSASGTRCPSCRTLEFDHIEPVARGGSSTVDNLRLRCRAHNQYSEEQIYDAEFMKAKIEEARRDGADGGVATGPRSRVGPKAWPRA